VEANECVQAQFMVVRRKNKTKSKDDKRALL
jgi:hypothetical protein